MWRRVGLGVAFILALAHRSHGQDSEDAKAQDRPVSYWIGQLKTYDPEKIEAAQKALVEIGQPAVQPLIDVFVKFDVRAINPARETLALMGPVVVPHLVRVVEDKKMRDDVKLHVAMALGGAGEPAARAVSRWLRGSDPKLRYWGSMVVASIESDFRFALPAIIERLAEGDTSNVGWQHDLALSHGSIGNVYAQQDKRDQALGAFHRGREIIAVLVNTSPENAKLQSSLAWLDAQIAALEL